MAAGLRVREHQSGVSAWTLLFIAHPDAKVHVSCVLDDGSHVAGQLWSFSRSAEDMADRELTLTAPITYRAPGDAEPAVLQAVSATVVSAWRIILLNVTYVATTN